MFIEVLTYHTVKNKKNHKLNQVQSKGHRMYSIYSMLKILIQFSEITFLDITLIEANSEHKICMLY